MRFLLSVFFMCLLWAVADVNACSCEPTDTLEAYRTTPVIVKGTVVSKSFVSLSSTMNDTALRKFKSAGLSEIQEDYLQLQVLRIELSVSEIYKGGLQYCDKVILYTTAHGGSCGYLGFRESEEFIVHASPSSFTYSFFISDLHVTDKLEEHGSLWTNLCTLTAPYSSDNEKTITQLQNLYPSNKQAPFHEIINDYDYGLNKARESNKPIFLMFTGTKCKNVADVNAVIMESEVIVTLLNKHFVSVILHVDDNSKLPEVELVWRKGRQHKIKTLGNKWAHLEMTQYDANYQPFITIIGFREDRILDMKIMMPDEEEVLEYLQLGLEAFNLSR